MLQYNFAKQINFNANYNKKITLPSTSSLNPNNTNYQNQNVAYSGNPQLQPTIYDNIEFFKNKNTRIDRKEKWETMYSAHKNHHEFVNMLRNEIYGIL